MTSPRFYWHQVIAVWFRPAPAGSKKDHGNMKQDSE